MGLEKVLVEEFGKLDLTKVHCAKYSDLASVYGDLPEWGRRHFDHAAAVSPALEVLQQMPREEPPIKYLVKEAKR